MADGRMDEVSLDYDTITYLDSFIKNRNYGYLNLNAEEIQLTFSINTTAFIDLVVCKYHCIETLSLLGSWGLQVALVIRYLVSSCGITIVVLYSLEISTKSVPGSQAKL